MFFVVCKASDVLSFQLQSLPDHLLILDTDSSKMNDFCVCDVDAGLVLGFSQLF